MIECIICKIDFLESDITMSPCNHGPYCLTCYNCITSPPQPTCSLCRGYLPRSINPNPRYIFGLNTIFSQNLTEGIDRYQLIEIISHGYNSSEDESFEQHENQEGQHFEHENRYSTPPRRPVIRQYELRQGNIRRQAVYNRNNNIQNTYRISETTLI